MKPRAAMPRTHNASVAWVIVLENIRIPPEIGLRSEAENDLLLQTILTRRERIQRHKEVRKVSAVAQLALNEQQTLQGHFLRQAIIEAKMVRANVHAAVGSEIVVGDLRDQSVGTLGCEHIKKGHVAALSDLANLQRSQQRITLFQTDADVACGLKVERNRISAATTLKSRPVETISHARDLKISGCVNRAAGSGRRVPGPGERTRKRDAQPVLHNQRDAVHRRSQLDLIRIAIQLNVAAELAAPAVVEFLIYQQALMKEIRIASGRSNNRSGLGQRTAGGHDRDVWVAEDVLPGTQLQTRNLEAVVLE